MEIGWEGWNLKNPFWKRAVTQLLPSLHGGKSPPSIQVKPQSPLCDSIGLGSGITTGVRMLLEGKGQVGSSVRKGQFWRKVYHPGFEAKRHHNYHSMWTTCPKRSFFVEAPPKEEVENSEQGKPERSLQYLGCGESEKQSA